MACSYLLNIDLYAANNRVTSEDCTQYSHVQFFKKYNYNCGGNISKQQSFHINQLNSGMCVSTD